MRLLCIAVALGLGLGAVAHGQPLGASGDHPAALVGRLAPPLVVEHLRGSPLVPLDQLKGRVVVLGFFSVFCGACKSVCTYIEGLHRAGDRRVRVLGITRDPPALLDRMLPNLNLSYTVARDDGATSRRYRVRALPAVVVVDGDGIVRHVTVGAYKAGPTEMTPGALPELDAVISRLVERTAQ